MIKELNNALMRINKPLQGFQVDVSDPKFVILRLLYEGVGKNGTFAEIRFKREKIDDIESIFDYLRPYITKEYLETHWD